MFLEINPLMNVVEMIQIFRIENNRWPAYAAELLRFSIEWKKSLSFSEFHILIFSAENESTLTMEFILGSESSHLTVRGRIEIKKLFAEGGTTFVWRRRYFPLPTKPVEKRSYCLVKI